MCARSRHRHRLVRFNDGSMWARLGGAPRMIAAVAAGQRSLRAGELVSTHLEGPFLDVTPGPDPGPRCSYTPRKFGDIR
jgi:hypothetical protein